VTEPTNDQIKPEAAGGASAEHDERRGEERIPHRALIVMPFGEGVEARFEHAEMLDCSAHGIGLLVQRPLRCRSRFFVKLKLSNVALIIYEVKHCRQTPEGYRIGADFHGVIGNELDRESTAEAVLAALLAL